MRKAYAEAIEELTKEKQNIVTVGLDTSSGMFDKIMSGYPKQFLEVGICESNAVGIAAGLASSGKIPFVYSMGAFLVNRAYEFIRLDACLQNQNVKLVGYASGIISSNFGPTHHATEDIAALRVLPNLVILSPASPKEVVKVVNAAANHVGPVYIRLGKSGEREIYNSDYEFNIGKGILIQAGESVTVFSTGSIISEVLTANSVLKDRGISLNIVNLPTIKPLDEIMIVSEAQKTGKVIVVEEHNCYGGLGGAITEVLYKNHTFVKFKSIALQDIFCKGYGSYDNVKKANGISHIQIIEEIENMQD